MLECNYGGVPMKLKQPVNWKHTTFLWILRFMLSGVAVSIVFQCLKIIELFSSRFYAVFDSLLAITKCQHICSFASVGHTGSKGSRKDNTVFNRYIEKI